MEASRNCVRGRTAIVDFLVLGANAFVGGLAAAVALAVIALALATSAQAAAPQPWSMAPASPPDRSAAAVGALWATAPVAQLAIGALAAAVLAIVAVIGWRALRDARGDAKR